MFRATYRSIAAVASLALVCALAFASVASASPEGPAPRVKVRRGTSLNWSGYAVQTDLSNPANNVVTDVKGTWKVPAVDHSSKTTGYSSVWVGIDGYSNGTVEQIGTEQDSIKGRPAYYAWYEMYPARGYRIPNAVSVGDTVTAEVSYNGGQFVLKLNDTTAGWTYSTAQSLSSALRSSAEWVVEAPSSGRVLPLANFGTVGLSGCQATLSGVTGSITAWPWDPMAMVTRKGVVKARPSGPGNNGSSFSVTWYHQ